MPRRWGLLGLAIAAVLGGVFPARADPLADLVVAASKEGALRLTWGEGSLGGSNGARLIVDAMNKEFGTSIKLQFTPGGSMGQLANQLLLEQQAKLPASTDVWLASTSQAGRAAQRQGFAAVDWPALLPRRIRPEMIEGNAVRLVSYMAGVTYNTRLLPDPPKTMDGFLAPQLKGRLATTPDASGFDIIAGDEFWGVEKTLAYAQRLSRQVSGLLRCNEMARIASGEYAGLILDCGGGEAIAMAEAGAPMAQMIPRDFRTERFFYLGLPVNSQHPAAAKLLITFMMTPEGQDLAWRTWHLDLSMFPESHAARILADSEKDGVKFRQLGVDWWLRTPESDDTKAKLIKIFRAPGN